MFARAPAMPPRRAARTAPRSDRMCLKIGTPLNDAVRYTEQVFEACMFCWDARHQCAVGESHPGGFLVGKCLFCARTCWFLLQHASLDPFIS